jgi:hypothetical protein
MPTATPPLLPIPTYSVPLIDPRTGRISTEWFNYFQSLDAIVRALRLEIP